MGVAGPDGSIAWRPVAGLSCGPASAFPLADGVVCNFWDGEVYFARRAPARRVAGARRVEPEPDGTRWAVERPGGAIELCTGELAAPTSRRLVHRVDRPRRWCFDWTRGEVLWSSDNSVWSAATPLQRPVLRYRGVNGIMDLAVDRRSGDLLVLMDAVMRGWMVSVPPGTTRPRWRTACSRTGTPIGELTPADQRTLDRLPMPPS